MPDAVRSCGMKTIFSTGNCKCLRIGVELENKQVVRIEQAAILGSSSGSPRRRGCRQEGLKAFEITLQLMGR